MCAILESLLQAGKSYTVFSDQSLIYKLSSHVFPLELDTPSYLALHELMRIAENKNNTILGEITGNEGEEWCMTLPEVHISPMDLKS